MNNFYVYEWIRLDTNEPFYVGKGKGGRSSVSFRNPYFNRVVEKVGIENIAVHILHDNLTEKLAFEYEIYYIYAYVYEFGFNLTNLTIGGEGTSGCKWTWTEEQCRARSGDKHPMWGRENKWGKHSEETRRKMSEALSGRKHSEEARRIMSENHADFSGEKNPAAKAIILIFHDGSKKEFGTIKEASLYLGGVAENCSVAKGIQNLLKGWTPKRGRWVGYSAMYKEEQEIA